MSKNIINRKKETINVADCQEITINVTDSKKVTVNIVDCKNYTINEVDAKKSYRAIGVQEKCRTEIKKQELKQCPFCGYKATHLKTMQGKFLIMCERCKSDGPTRETLDEAKAAWNNRVELPE